VPDDNGGRYLWKHIDIYVGDGKKALDLWYETGGNRLVRIVPSSNFPTVTSFKVEPSAGDIGQIFTISGSVSSGEGATLQQVELWRNDADPSNQNEWKRIGSVVTIPPGQTDYSYSFEDSPDVAGDYWYGIHVVDSNTWAHEGVDKIGRRGSR